MSSIKGIRKGSFFIANAALNNCIFRIKKAAMQTHNSFTEAIDGARTRGLDLGKVARYQLRHYRRALI